MTSMELLVSLAAEQSGPAWESWLSGVVDFVPSPDLLDRKPLASPRDFGCSAAGLWDAAAAGDGLLAAAAAAAFASDSWSFLSGSRGDLSEAAGADEAGAAPTPAADACLAVWVGTDDEAALLLACRCWQKASICDI